MTLRWRIVLNKGILLARQAPTQYLINLPLQDSTRAATWNIVTICYLGTRLCSLMGIWDFIFGISYLALKYSILREIN